MSYSTRLNQTIRQQTGAFGWLAWIATWGTALAGPFGGRFEKLLKQRRSIARHTYTWIALAGLPSLLILAGLAWKIPFQLPLAVCLTPALLLALVALFVIYTVVTHKLARLLGGRGYRNDLALLIAAYMTPLLPAAAWLASRSERAALLIPLGGYALALNVSAVQAVYRLDWKRAGVAGAWFAVVSLAALGIILSIGSFAITL